MTARVLVRQGGAVGAGTTDFNVFTPPKGAPAFDHPGTTLLSGGMRWADGEASAATFKILDPNGELPRLDGQYNLPAHTLVTFTEDASGCPYWWHRGRMSGPINYGRGEAKAGSAREFDATSDDGNVELKGQAFVEAWVRPQETDYERLVALQAYTLNGTASTATYHRDTCEVIVLDSHLCKNAHTVIMPATTYPIGTQPLDVVADCATTAGKDYGVVTHHAPANAADVMSWTDIPITAESEPNWPFTGTVHKVVGIDGSPVIEQTLGHGADGFTGSQQLSVVVDGAKTDRMIVAFVANEYGASGAGGGPSGVVYHQDGVNNSLGTSTSMTQLGPFVDLATTVDPTTGVRLSAWYLLNPDPSSLTHDGSVTATGMATAVNGEAIQVYVLSGAAQTPPNHNENVADGTTSISTSGSGSLLLDAIAYFELWNATAAATPDASQTLDGTNNNYESFGIMATALQTSHKTGVPSDCSHLCLQYIVPTDLTTNPCTLKISDQRSEVDEDTASPPTTYAPRWLNGKAGTWDTQDQLSGVIYQYQTATGSGTIFTQNTSDITSYDYWVEAVSDSLVGTPAAAAQRAPAILATRRLSRVTGKVSVPLAADQLHLIEAGMAISIKSAAFIGSNPYVPVTMRIVQTLKEPRNDGTYWVHMELNRPQRMVPNGNIGGAVGQPTKATIVSGTFAGDSVQQALEALAAGTTGPLTTLGDMLYRGTGGSNTRLPIGGSNTHLVTDGTVPYWASNTSASGMTNPMTTAWDLIRGGTGGTPTRFALGASNTVLSSDGTQFLWDTKPSGGSGTGLTDPMTTIGDIIVRDASNVTARLGIGASNTVLTSLGSGIAPSWVTPTAGGGGGGWTQIVNEDGSSLANWTAHGGTWASSGGEITATNTGVDQRLIYSAGVVDWGSGFVFEADVQAVSGSGDHPVGLFYGTDVNASNGAPMVGINTNNNIQFENLGISAVTRAYTVATGTYYTLRVLTFGPQLTAYVNGVLVAYWSTSFYAPGVNNYIGLRAYTISAKFRNIKAWRLTQP